MLSRLCKLPINQSFFLYGPRGSGKSTLLKQHFHSFHGADTLWINLSDPIEELTLARHPQLLLERWNLKKTKWIVIDDIQKLPALIEVVRQGIEEHKIKFALAGSNDRKFKNEASGLLAGRALERRLAPYSVLELGSKFNLDKALKFGLLPVLWNDTGLETEPSSFLISYVNSYIKEEIVGEQLVRQLEPFRKFLTVAAQVNGQILNHSAIERRAGIPRKQSERYFTMLADTLWGNYLPAYSTSIRRRQALKSKFYFFDTGVVGALQRIAGQELEGLSFDYGTYFETFLVNEIFKLSSVLQKRWDFFYYRATSDDNEINLIIERPNAKPLLIHFHPMTVLLEDQLGSFPKLAKEIPHAGAYLFSNALKVQEYNGIRCLPWRQGLREIFELPEMISASSSRPSLQKESPAYNPQNFTSAPRPKSSL